jgi:hypothetical protein
VGIALTYARRYSLLAIIGLAPEDDDDANSASSDNHEPARSGTPPGRPEKRPAEIVEPFVEELPSKSPAPPEGAERRPRFAFWHTTLSNCNSPKGLEAAWTRCSQVWAQFSVDEQTVLIDTKEAIKRQLGIA